MGEGATETAGGREVSGGSGALKSEGRNGVLAARMTTGYLVRGRDSGETLGCMKQVGGRKGR